MVVIKKPPELLKSKVYAMSRDYYLKYMKNYNQNNKARISEYNRLYYQKNKYKLDLKTKLRQYQRRNKRIEEIQQVEQPKEDDDDDLIIDFNMAIGKII